IAAGELGASLDDVVVLGGDTTLMPYGMGTGGSRVMVNAGPAVARTAAQVRERAAVVAAEIFECAPADVRFEASRAFVAGVPDRTLPLGRLAQAAVRSKTLGASSGEPGLNAWTWFYPDTMPRADDPPWLDVTLAEHPSIVNALGVKGVGESGCIAGASAVANAVEDALADRGVIVRELPIAPARLFALLHRRA